MHWTVALTVIMVALGFKFMTKGILSNAAILLRLIAGYLVAFMFGIVNFAAVGKAS